MSAPDIGFVIYDITSEIEPLDELDIKAEPGEGLSPLGVQFTNIDAEEE